MSLCLYKYVFATSYKYVTWISRHHKNPIDPKLKPYVWLRMFEGYIEPYLGKTSVRYYVF